MAMLQRTFDVTIMSPPQEWTTGLVSGARPHFLTMLGRKQHGIESGAVQIPRADAMNQTACLPSPKAGDSMSWARPHEHPASGQLNGSCGCIGPIGDRQ